MNRAKVTQTCNCAPDLVLADLFLLRHGIAEAQTNGQSSAGRKLTMVGRRKTLAVARRLRKLGFRADRLFSSPYQRARETAEIAVLCGLANRMELEDSLMPGGDCLPLLVSCRARWLFVGHEPDLSKLAAHLIGASVGCFTLHKAGFAHLHWTAGESNPYGSAVLMVLLRPRVLLSDSV